MTEKRALEKSIEMWEELKELNKKVNSNSIAELKELYFDKILKNNPKYSVPVGMCYLCEFARNKNLCENCPIKNWSIYRKYGAISKYCTGSGSAYKIGAVKDIINNVLELLKETYNDLYNN